MKLIVPYFYLHDFSSPTIYLDGPIKDSLNWRKEVIRFFAKNYSCVALLSPQKNFEGCSDITPLIVKTSDYSFGQANWVKYHLKRTIQEGFVLVGNESIDLEKVCENAFVSAFSKFRNNNPSVLKEMSSQK